VRPDVPAFALPQAVRASASADGSAQIGHWLASEVNHVSAERDPSRITDVAGPPRARSGLRAFRTCPRRPVRRRGENLLTVERLVAGRFGVAVVLAQRYCRE